MFLTVEDETGIANLIIWPKVFEKYRRVVLSAALLGVYGRLQREGEVVHLISHRLIDLSAELATIGDRDIGLRPQASQTNKPHQRHKDFNADDGQNDGPLANMGDFERKKAGIRVKPRDFR
jgi:error-prone DNA polymerase